MATLQEIQIARDRGFTPEQIIDVLIEKDPDIADKIQTARDKKFTDNQILNVIAKPKEPIPDEEGIGREVPKIDTSKGFFESLPQLAKDAFGIANQIGTDVGRVGIETATLPIDLTRNLQQRGQDFLGDLVPALKTPEDAPPLTQVPSGRDISNFFLGDLAEGEGGKIDQLVGGTAGFLTGGPIGALAGFGLVEPFKQASEAVERSELPDVVKSGLQFAGSAFPFVAKGSKAKPLAKPQAQVKALAQKTNPFREPLQIEQPIGSTTILDPQTPLQPGEPPQPAPIEAGRITRPVPQAIPPEQLPQPIGEQQTELAFRNQQLNEVSPQNISREDLAGALGEVNREAETAAKQRTRNLYQRSEVEAQGLTTDTTDLALDTLKLIKNVKTLFLANQRPAIKKALFDSLKEFNLTPELLRKVEKLEIIDSFLGGELREDQIPESMRRELEDPDKFFADRETLAKDIEENLKGTSGKLPTQNLVRIVQNLNDIIDFGPRDLRQSVKPLRRLNDYRRKVNNRIEEIGDANDSFGDAYDAARASHRQNVETFGRDFIIDLNRQESGTGVIAKQLSNADAPNNIAAQMDILNRTPQGKALIPELERRIISENFEGGKVKPGNREIFRDIRNRLSGTAQEVADRLTEFGDKTDVEKALQIADFDQPTLDKMKNIRGLQSVRNELREISNRIGADLIPIYEQEFIRQTLDELWNPNTLFLDEKKFAEFENNRSLRNSMDEMGGNRFTQNWIEFQRNARDITIVQERALVDKIFAEKKLDTKYADNLDGLKDDINNIKSQNISTAEKIALFRDAFFKRVKTPLSAGVLWLMAHPILKALFIGFKAFKGIQAGIEAIGGKKGLIKRLNNQSKRTLKGKITQGGIISLGNSINRAIANIDKEDEELLQRLEDEMLFDIFDEPENNGI